MSTTTNNIKLTCGYKDTDFTRKYTITGVDSLSADKETVRGKVQAINGSLEGGTSDGLDTFFRSDDYDASESIGAFSGITEAVISNVTETVIIQRGE